MIVDGDVRLWPCDRIRIEVSDEQAPAAGAPVEARWRELCAQNPKHFDGPILSMDAFDPETGVVSAHVDSYKRLAVQPEVDTQVTLLAATAVVIARREAGDECVLVIQRHEQTRHYGGLWELGPSGGIDPTGADVLVLDDVTALLQRELAEEAGLTDELLEPASACVYVDGASSSFDIVVRARLEATVEALGAGAGRTHWDASASRWVPLRELRRFVSSMPCIPPTRLVVEALGLGDSAP